VYAVKATGDALAIARSLYRKYLSSWASRRCQSARALE
jgi:hypothetical protein